MIALLRLLVALLAGIATPSHPHIGPPIQPRQAAPSKVVGYPPGRPNGPLTGPAPCKLLPGSLTCPAPPVAPAADTLANPASAAATVTLITKSPIHRPTTCVTTRIVGGVIVHYPVPCQWYRRICVYHTRSGQPPSLVRCYRAVVGPRT